MNTALISLKKAWNENPVAVLAAGAAVAVAAAKLLEATSSVQSKRAYAKKMSK